MMEFDVIVGGPNGSTKTVRADSLDRSADGLVFYQDGDEVASYMSDSHIMRAEQVDD